jgi:hypothetical protein
MNLLFSEQDCPDGHGKTVGFTWLGQNLDVVVLAICVCLLSAFVFL